VPRSVVIGISTERLTRDRRTWTPEDRAHIVAVARRPWALQLLARSLAPSIYGHDLIKEGLVLQLLGGVERHVNKTHIRRAARPQARATPGGGEKGVHCCWMGLLMRVHGPEGHMVACGPALSWV
jgi:hypothetical protein